MAISRKIKEAWVEDFRRSVESSPCVFVTAPRGLNASEASRLRRRVREGGARYRVVRNRLARRALKGTSHENLAAMLKGGERGVAFASDAIAVSKVISDFAKELDDRFVIVGGVMDGVSVDAAQVKALASLPPLEVLRARLLGVLQAPATGLVRTVKEPAASVARVLSAADRRVS